ncbi:hypothetical protein [Pseudomonas sp. URMO17WK12:I11]|uniref:hypothetical protein n=1 Tax=Pseudomonas sp. URMO17WK12:I11 TaxID=1283291 RepID=UPI0011A775BC|nr:hypothetical protein [Pseudomonas sp. URMO17WK12:I11]
MTITEDKVQQEIRMIEGQIRSLQTAGKGNVATLSSASGAVMCLGRLGLIDGDLRNELLERLQTAFDQG